LEVWPWLKKKSRLPPNLRRAKKLPAPPARILVLARRLSMTMVITQGLPWGTSAVIMATEVIEAVMDTGTGRGVIGTILKTIGMSAPVMGITVIGMTVLIMVITLAEVTGIIPKALETVDPL
jgi:hypothetical protein